MTKESLYDFRKRLTQIHKEGIRDYNLTPGEDEFEIKEGMKLVIEKDASEVIKNAAKDFKDYLKASMGISVDIVQNGNGDIYLSIAKDTTLLKNAASYKGFACFVSDSITLLGFDDRGVAQALYFLEDEMSVRKAPFIKKVKPTESPCLHQEWCTQATDLTTTPMSTLQP